MSKKSYDVAIYGLNLENFILADHLKQKGISFIIFSEQNAPNESPFENKLDSFFYSPKEKSTIDYEQKTLRNLNFESGKFKDFVGFGKNKQDFDYSIYLNTDIYEWKKDSDSLILDYCEKYQDHILFQAKITNVEINETQDRLNNVEINEQKKLAAKLFLWTQKFDLASDLLGPDIFGLKNTQKLAKSKFWTRLDLHILHSEAWQADTNARYILMAGTDNAIPILGRYYYNQENRLCSQWGAFIDSSLSDSGEELGNLLREEKRQIKRAFSGFFEQVEFEKIQIISDIYNDYEIKETKPFQTSALSNFFSYNHNFHRFVHKIDGFQNLSRLADSIENFLENDVCTDIEVK